jgi:flagellar M-ring protein FliF
VTVIDETGNVLSQSDDAAGQLDAQSALEKSLELRVREMVGKLVGEGHVAVVVTAEMDYSRTQRTELQVGKEGTISHENPMEERAGADVGTAGGVAGARGNLPGTGTPTTPTTGPGTSGLVKLSDDKQYEISKVTETTVNPNSRIKRLHLAILVDQADKTPRSADELARISALAREAAGFSKERGDLIEVHSAPFATAPAEPEPAAPVSSWPLPIPPLYAAIAAGGLILLVAGGAIFFVMRRKKAKNKRQVLTALPVKVSELEKTAEGGQLPGGSTVPQLPEKSPRERALEACKTDAERAARVIAAWLLEGQEGGRSA